MEGGDFLTRKAYFRTVTNSVDQLTIGCVDDTCVHFGFVVENDYEIRSVEYNELIRGISLAIVIG